MGIEFKTNSGVLVLTEKKEKIFIYLRVSTELQDEKSQKTMINNFLKDKSIEIIHEFVDHAISGKAGVDRPAFNEMLLRLDEVDGLCVFDYDRLTRDEERGIMLMYEIRNKGKKVYEARTNSILNFEPMSERVLTVLKSMMAEEERKKIHARQAAGIQTYKDKNGRWGRKTKKINWKKFDEYRELNLSISSIAKLFGISQKTMFRRIKERNLDDSPK